MFRSLAHAVKVTSTVFVAVAVLLVPSVAHAIAHGENAPEGAYPFAVKFTFTGMRSSDGDVSNGACSGVLVAPQWVVTAGHCFHDGDQNRVSGRPRFRATATVGRTVAADKTRGHVVNVVLVKQAPDRDLAVVKLAKPVTDVKPIKLSRKAPVVGMKLRMAAWGSLVPEPMKAAHRLQTGVFKVSKVTPTTVDVKGFAPSRDTSACGYDSGGPYFIKSNDGFVLVSIENMGPDCPHVYDETTARIDTAVTWISRQIKR